MSARTLDTSNTNAFVSNSIPCLPRVIFDETDESLVANVAAKNGIADFRDATCLMFGSRNVDVSRPFHFGFQHLRDIYAKHDEDFACQVIDRSSFLALFRPFLSMGRYKLASTIMLCAENPKQRINSLGIGDGVFKDLRSHCPRCVAESVELLGYAPVLRSHQIRGVSVCHIHGCALIDGCTLCGAPFPRQSQILAACQRCGQPWRAPEQSLAKVPPVFHRYARLVAAVFHRKVPSAVDHRWYQERARRVVASRSGNSGENLARHLLAQYGRSFLEHVCRSPLSAPTFGWPALFLERRVLMRDPLAGLLLIAALAEEGEWGNLPTSPESEWTYDRCVPNSDLANEVNATVLRALYAGESTRLIASAQKISYGRLKRWTAAYPGLRQRIDRYRIQSARRTLARAAIRTPDATRTAIELCHSSEYRLLSKVDPEWLKRQFPSKRICSSALAPEKDGTHQADVADYEIQ